MSKFLINKSNANISLCNNTIVLAVGGNTTISDADADNREIVDAVRRGWIDMIDEQPAPAEPFKPELTFENAKPQGSLTIPGKEPVVEEVKEEVAPATKRGGKKIGAAE